MNAKRFEDLIAWQKARVLVNEVYSVTRRPEFCRDFELLGQIRRSAISILSNIAEGFGRAKSAEFMYFLRIALGSCAEMQAQLYVALDAKYLDSEIFARVYGRADEVARIVAGLRDSIRRRTVD